MTVKELIRVLTSDVNINADAEVMIRAPLGCNRGTNAFSGNLDLPTCGIETGQFESGPEYHKPWVMILGIDVWGISPKQGKP